MLDGLINRLDIAKGRIWVWVYVNRNFRKKQTKTKRRKTVKQKKKQIYMKSATTEDTGMMLVPKEEKEAMLAVIMKSISKN